MNFHYQLITHAFCLIVVMSNLLSAKFVPFLTLNIPVGLLFYPLTFLLSDFVTEIYGTRHAKQMTYMAFGMCILSIVILQIALILPTNSFQEQAVFQSVFGLGGWRTVSSLIAYLTSQLVDISLYAKIKQWTGHRFLWLRNNGSTWIAQIVDTIIIDILFLYWALNMEIAEVLPVMLFSFVYKAFFSVANTPFLYLFVFLIRNRTIANET